MINDNSSFQVYIDYVLLKKHFSDEQFIWCETASYKKMKHETFLKRNDIAFFQALYNRYKNRKQIVDHLISSFIFNNEFWIGDALKDEYIMRHHNRMFRMGALERTFVDDCEKIEEYMQDHELNFDQLVLTCGPNCRIIDLYPGTISLETLAVLEYLTWFTRTWFPINPLQKWRRLIIYKYQYLLRVDERNMEKIQNAYQHLLRI